MQIIDKLISEYSKSLSTNSIVFQKNRSLKICFNIVFWLYIFISFSVSLKLLFLNFDIMIICAFALLNTSIFLPVLQWIKNKAINKNFPKIKTSIWKLNYSEITGEIEKNTEKFILENRLENKLTEVSNQLGQKLEVTKSQNFVLFSIMGAILVVFLSSFLTSLFDRLKDISISAFIGISILVLISIIFIGVGLFYIRMILDDFATEYQKISSIKNYIDDYRLKNT